LIAGYTIGWLILVNEAFMERKGWLIGLMILMVSNVVVLAMPVLRGYASYGRVDVPTEIGWTADIVSEGRVDPENIHPIMNVFGASLALVLGFSSLQTWKLIPTLMSLTYVLLMYPLAASVFSSRRTLALAMGASTVLLFVPFNVFVTSFGNSIFFLPVMFFIYLKKIERTMGSRQCFICLIPFILMYPLLHVLTTTFVVGGFMAAEVMRIVHEKGLFKRNNNLRGTLSTPVWFKAPLTLGIVLALWITEKIYLWAYSIKLVIRWFSGEFSQSTSEYLRVSFARINLQALDIIELLLKTYGHILIFLCISFIGVMKVLRKPSLERSERLLFYLLGPMSVATLMQIQDLIAPAVNTGLRVSNFLLVFTPILVAYMMGNGKTSLASVRRIPVTRVATISMILLLTTTLGVFSAHPSPYIMRDNHHIPYAELKGLSWMYEYKSRDLPANWIRDWTIAQIFMGKEEGFRRADIVKIAEIWPLGGMIPNHFGYTIHKTLRESYPNGVYFAISQHDVFFYIDLYPELQRINNESLVLLTSDTTVVKIFSNGEVKGWLVLPIR